METDRGSPTTYEITPDFPITEKGELTVIIVLLQLITVIKLYHISTKMREK